MEDVFRGTLMCQVIRPCPGYLVTVFVLFALDHKLALFYFFNRFFLVYQLLFIFYFLLMLTRSLGYILLSFHAA